MLARFKPDKEQRKHLAALFDKAAISFLGLFGYNAITQREWLAAGAVALVFVVCQAGILVFIKERNDETK